MFHSGEKHKCNSLPGVREIGTDSQTPSQDPGTKVAAFGVGAHGFELQKHYSCKQVDLLGPNSLHVCKHVDINSLTGLKIIFLAVNYLYPLWDPDWL